MNPKTTNTLLILLLMVGAYFLVFEWQPIATRDKESVRIQSNLDQGASLFSSGELPLESVDSIAIQRGDRAIQLSKEGQGWLQSQPVRFGLDASSVRQVISDAVGLQYFQRFEPSVGDDGEGPTLEQLSLASPEAIVTFGMGGTGSTQIIKLGRQVVGGQAYAMINADKHVYVVDDALHRTLFDQGVNQWRVRTLSAPTEGAAQQVVLSHSDHVITVRKADGHWSLHDPHSGRVDRHAVKELLSAIGQLHIQAFVADRPPDLAAYGLDQPLTTVSIGLPAAVFRGTTQPATAPSPGGELQRSAIKTLKIGAATDLKKEQFFATWASEREDGDVVFTVLAAEIEKFTQSADDLRDARMTPISADDVRQLTIHQSPAEPVEFVRMPDGWSFAPPGPGFEADSQTVVQWVEAVTTAIATGYDSNVRQLANPFATITLVASGHMEPDVLRVYAMGEAPTYFVLRNSESVLYLVPKASLSKVLQPAISLRQRTVFHVDSHTLSRVMIEHGQGPTYVFERTKSGDANLQVASTQPHGSMRVSSTAVNWQLLGHERYEAQALNRLLLAFSPLRAQGWVSPSSSPPSGILGRLVDGQLTVRLESAGGQPQTILVDRNRRIGRLTDGAIEEAEWFELDDAFIDLVFGEFRNRTVLPAVIDQIESVQIIRGEESVSIRRDEFNQYVAQEHVGIDQSAAGRLFDTLVGLRVDRFIEPTHISLPPLRVVLQSPEGQTHRLAFAQPNDPQAAVTNGDQWFTLEAETLQQLNAAIAALSDQIPGK